MAIMYISYQQCDLLSIFRPVKCYSICNILEVENEVKFFLIQKPKLNKDRPEAGIPQRKTAFIKNFPDRGVTGAVSSLHNRINLILIIHSVDQSCYLCVVICAVI